MKAGRPRRCVRFLVLWRRNLVEEKCLHHMVACHPPFPFWDNFIIDFDHIGFYREGLTSRGTHNTGMSSMDSTDYSKSDYYMPKPTDEPQHTYHNEQAPDEGRAMLDGRPVYFRAPPSTISEMPDTSPLAIRNRQALSPSSSVTTNESPILGRNTLMSARGQRLAEKVTRNQHIMSWNNYDDKSATKMPEAMSAGLSSGAVSPPDGSPRMRLERGETFSTFRPSPLEPSDSRFGRNLSP